MSSHAFVPWTHRVVSRRTVALSLAAIAVALMIAGGALPWLVVFNGLTAVAGFSLDGGILAGVMLAVLAVLFVQAQYGGARILRPIAIVASAAVVADSLYSAWRILSYSAAPGPTGILTMPTPGVGPYVFAAAGAILLAVAVIAPARPGRMSKQVASRLALSVLLLVAAIIHLILTPEHLGISPLLGAGFLVAGVAQLVLAGTAVGARGRVEVFGLSAIVVVNVALIGIYLYAVLVGLPIEAGHAADDAGGLKIGGGEPVDVKGGVDLVAEIAAVAIAAVVGFRAKAPRTE